jgi:GPH family glycoside/pentoside/hexuronide:cation symporter
MQEKIMQEKISLKEKIGYSVGDTASNLFFQTFILFITIFYTDVFGITAKAVGTMFLITKIWDAINDPLMGIIADRTDTKWGKFRPYLAWVAVPFGVLGVLAFTTPEFGSLGKLVYAYITYTLIMMAYTAINVPYSALMGVMTANSDERTVLSTFRFVAAFIGQLIVQYSVLKMVDIFGQESEATGWQIAMGVLSALAVILFFITFLTTKERVHPPKNQVRDFKKDFADLKANVPWILIGSATIFQMIFNVMRGGAIVYFVEYYVKDQAFTFFGREYLFTYKGITSTYMMVGTVMTIIAVLITPMISKRIGKAAVYKYFLIVAGISSGLVIFLKPDNLIMLFLLQMIASFAIGPVSVTQWALYTDTADYSEWKQNRRATGLVMSASLFALKLGIALGVSGLAWILAAHGYEPNVAQADHGLLGIRMVMSVYPMIAALIGGGLMFFYKLDHEMMVEIETELVRRRNEE